MLKSGVKLVSIICVLAVLLSGCSRLADVRLRLVVHAIGVDIDEEGVYSVSYQVFSSNPPEGGGPVDANKGNVMTYMTYGRTLYEAQKSLELQTGKEVFTGDVELIVLGLGMVGRDVSQVLSYFWSDTDIYMGVNAVFSRGLATDIIGVQLEQGTATTELLNQMIISSVANGTTIPARLIEISNCFEEPGASIVMPVLTAKEADNSKGKEDSDVYDMATGVFENMLIVNKIPTVYVTRDETKGISILTGGKKKYSLTFVADGQRISAGADLSRVSRKIRIDDSGNPVLSVDIRGELTVLDNPTLVDNDIINEAAREDIIRLCREAYDKTVSSYGADVLEIGKLLRKHCNKYYETVKDDISQAIRKTSCEVSVSLKIYENE